MKKILLLFVLGMYVPASYGQDIAVTQMAEKVKGKTLNGHSVTLIGSGDKVGSFLYSYLKKYGRVRDKGQYLQLTHPVFKDTTFQDKSLYAFVQQKDEATYTWLGVDEDDWDEGDLELVHANLENIVYAHGVAYYRMEAQTKIDETQIAWDATEKQLQRLGREINTLSKKLLGNEQEKIKLEEAQVNNAVKHENLLARIENNRLARDSVSMALLQIKKMMAHRKEEFRKIH